MIKKTVAGYMECDMKEPQKVANAIGAICHLPGPKELFLDIDDPKDINLAIKHIDLINDKLKWNLKITEIRPSATIGHSHAIVTTDRPHEFSNLERILLQAVLGSDRKKELWGFLNCLRGIKNPTALFTYPKEDALLF